MRTAWVNAAIVATLLAASEQWIALAHAQELQLGRPGAPDLGDTSYCWELAEQLEEEAELLRTAADGEPNRLLHTVLQARANTRAIAQQLLERAHDGGPDGSVAALLGLTLSNGLESLDRALSLEFWPSGFDPAGADAHSSADRFADAYWSLIRFNEHAQLAETILTDTSAEALDRACQTLLAPLRDALEAIENRLSVSHSIARSAPLRDATAGGASAGDIQEAPPILAERMMLVDLPEETRTILVRICAMLDQAAEFPEFKRQADAYRRHIEGAVSFAEALRAADWIPGEVRDRTLARLHASVVLFENKPTRSAGEAQLARLSDTRQYLERLNELASLPRRRLRPVEMLDAFLTTQDMLADSRRAPAAREHLVRLNGIVDRMVAWRRMREPQIRRELKVACANLDRMYEHAEERLLEALVSIGDASIGADPNLLALLANHAQIVSDLEHVQAIPAWMKHVEEVQPNTVERLESQLRAVSSDLIDPARRAAAVLIMNDFARWMGMLFPLPCEESLRTGTAEAASMTAGQHAAVIAQVDQLRREWLEARAEDLASAAEAELRLRLVHRHLTIMHVAIEFGRGGEGNASSLNRWLLWELAPQASAAALTETANRLRLASQASGTGNASDLEAQLDRIDDELALGVLVARLCVAAQPQLADMPEGALASIEQVAPAVNRSDAWLAAHRDNLAALCRYAAEEAWARERGDTALADACAQYVNTIARDLFRETDSPR